MKCLNVTIASKSPHQLYHAYCTHMHTCMYMYTYMHVHTHAHTKQASKDCHHDSHACYSNSATERQQPCIQLACPCLPYAIKCATITKYLFNL